MIISIVVSVLTVMVLLIIIMAFRVLRNIVGFGGLAPTGVAGSVANAIGQ